jgi:tRNA pseudouridine55 synthase
MARTKKGKPVHGWVILDKPVGMTSTQAVGAIKRIFEAQKAGHAGTLDPLATGILPIALGEATKTVPFAVDGEKAYRFTVRFGAETDTDDAEGKVVRTSDALPPRPAIEALLPRFTGEILQVPPQFSAIKVDGARAYDLAREGEEVVLEPREVLIEDLSLIEMPDAATAVFEARCGKGTYVRALARDMGRALGCFGHVIELRRTRVGSFDEAASVTLEELQAAAQAGGDGVMGFLMPVEAALDDLPGLSVGPNDAASLARGQAVLVRGRDAPVVAGAAWAHFKGRILALGELEKGAFRPTRVFNFG